MYVCVMYVGMYECMCVCMYVCVMYVCVYYVCMFVCIMYVCMMHVCMCVYIYISVRNWVFGRYCS